MDKKPEITGINFVLTLSSILFLALISGFLSDNLSKFCLVACTEVKMPVTIQGIAFISLSLGLRAVVLFFMFMAGWLYFRKRDLFLKILIVWLWIAAAGLVIYIIPLLQMGPLWRFLIKIHLSYPIAALIFIIAWVFYLRKSKQIKQIFIHKLAKADIIFFILAFFSSIIIKSVSFYNEWRVMAQVFR
jgi:hypothetical protein